MATMATVVGLFNTSSQAQHAVETLINAGTPSEDISIVTDDTRAEHAETISETAPVQSAATSDVADEGAFGSGLLGALVATGLQDHQAHAYAEGAHRGGTIVMVKTNTDAAVAIQNTLNSNGAEDINARATEWRAAGWNGFFSNAGPYFGEQQEGDPIPDPDADLDPADTSPAASVGALSGGTVPGVYGAAGETIFGNDDAARPPDWERD